MKNILSALGLALIGLAAAAATPAPKPAVTRYIVTFDAKAKKADREAVLGTLGLAPVRQIATEGDTNDEVSIALVEVPKGQDLKETLKTLTCPDQQACDEALKRIVSVEEDRRIKWIEQASLAFSAAPLPSFGSVMEGLAPQRERMAGMARAASMTRVMLDRRPELPWGVNRVHAPAAWDVTEGAGVKVAVIDTGIDMSHPDLVGRVDGGYSALKKTENPGDFADDNGHGTHVAGTIGASKDGRGVVGVAPKARLYAVKVLDADGSGQLSDVIDGIVWAAENDMQVANMSLGAPVDSDGMRKAVRYARAKGVIIVAAAGNSGKEVGYPGSYDDVICVSASDYRDQLASFSSRGPQVDFIAPGVDVVSSKLGGGYVSFSGTSMATPHVTGLAALTVSQGYVGLNGPDGVMVQLQKAARKLPELTDEQQGFGMIDAGRLVR